MIGRSPAFPVLQKPNKTAAFDAPVLIEGGSGTGKELGARALLARGGTDYPCGSAP
jgi:DNA-binding NtrC family response regulator